MDWAQHLVSLVAAFIGGVLVLAGDRWRARHEAKSRRAETIVRLYTDFLVAFQAALHANEMYWRATAFNLERGSDHKESVEAGQKRRDAEAAFRDAAWALRLRERDPDQQSRIEAIVVALDEDLDDLGHFENYAYTFSETAKVLRNDARSIVQAMQQIHQDALDNA